MAARDITDRQAEAQLRRQAIVFDRMTDMVLLTDDSGRIVDCNPSTERISGWGRSDILGTLPGPAPGRTRRPSASPTSASRSRPRTVGRGRHVRDGRGPHGVAECVIVPLRERDGSLGGTILVGRDVRASRAAAGALREAEQRFTQAFTHAPIGGAAHQPVRCGRRDVPERKPGLLRDARLPARGAARAHVRRHHRPDDLAGSRYELQRLLTGESAASQLEKRYVRRDGRVIWVSLSAAGVRDADGEPLYTVTHVQDVTQQRADRERVATATPSWPRRTGAAAGQRRARPLHGGRRPRPQEPDHGDRRLRRAPGGRRRAPTRTGWRSRRCGRSSATPTGCAPSSTGCSPTRRRATSRSRSTRSTRPGCSATSWPTSVPRSPAAAVR